VGTATTADATAKPVPQAGFRDVFAIREFRALYLSLVTSSIGDYLARAAVTVLVFQQTGSVALSAASFAVSYLPAITGGPLLAALAERYPYRRVMISSDLLRMMLIALVAIPGLPIPVVLLLLFLATLAAPPAQAVKSAMLPQILGSERLVVALAANAATFQATQVVGYLAGASLATAVNPRVALLLDALALAISALLIFTGVRARPAATDRRRRTHLLRETAEGFRMVFGTRVLRAIALVVFSVILFAVVPEGLAAAWAQQTDPGVASRGLAQGLIMAATPAGFVLGGLLIGRLPAATRQRLVRPLAVLAPLALVPSLARPSAPVVALLALVTGFAVGGLTPTLNGTFVLALPHGYRARAFGVMQSGMQLFQGVAVILTGILASAAPLPVVVGLWSVGGALLMGVLVARWPSAAAFEQAIGDAAAGAPPGATGLDAPPRATEPGPPQAGSTAATPGGDPDLSRPARSAGAHRRRTARATRVTSENG
jgi:MFS family permease